MDVPLFDAPSAVVASQVLIDKVGDERRNRWRQRRLAVARGVGQIKLVGYTPLAASVFLVGSYIALTAVRLYWVPLLEAVMILFT